MIKIQVNVEYIIQLLSLNRSFLFFVYQIYCVKRRKSTFFERIVRLVSNLNTKRMTNHFLQFSETWQESLFNLFHEEIYLREHKRVIVQLCVTTALKSK